MITASEAFAGLPEGLRDPLIAEYRHITQNYMERKWLPSELSGGRFCDIVYTILDGYASGAYADRPSKPADLVQACRRLESNASVPRSLQILIPRMLPALYEVRNHRGVGHVGGDVDPNHMDASTVLSMTSWIMGELVRVFHALSTEDAQRVVDLLVERRIPAVWQTGEVKRVLNPQLVLRDQILLLIYSSPAQVLVDDLLVWTDYSNRSYFMRIVRELHTQRMVELSADERRVEILPPGAKYIDEHLVPKLV